MTDDIDMGHGCIMIHGMFLVLIMDIYHGIVMHWDHDSWVMNSNHSSSHTSHSCHTHTWIFVSYAYVEWLEVWLKSISLCLYFYFYIYFYLLFLVSILLLKNNEYHKKKQKNPKKTPKIGKRISRIIRERMQTFAYVY